MSRMYQASHLKFETNQSLCGGGELITMAFLINIVLNEMQAVWNIFSYLSLVA